MENTEPIGKRVKRLRRARKLTQSKFAEKVGRDPHTIKDYESGRTKPSVEAIGLMAAVLGVKTSELLDGPVSDPQPIEIGPGTVLRRYLNIPDEIVNLAEKLGPRHDIWNAVRANLEGAIEKIEQEKPGKKHA